MLRLRGQDKLVAPARRRNLVDGEVGAREDGAGAQWGASAVGSAAAAEAGETLGEEGGGSGLGRAEEEGDEGGKVDEHAGVPQQVRRLLVSTREGPGETGVPVGVRVLHCSIQGGGSREREIKEEF